MKRKKNKLFGFDVDPSASWSVVKVLPNGSEEVLAAGLTLDHAAPLAERHLSDCRPGEKVSLREAPVFEF